MRSALPAKEGSGGDPAIARPVRVVGSSPSIRETKPEPCSVRVGHGELDDGPCSRFPSSMTTSVVAKGDTLGLEWLESRADGSCFAWRRRSHADPIRESRTRGGEKMSPKTAAIAAQAAPLTVAGHARSGDRTCGRRVGSRHLVADESERTAGHRRPVRCQRVPRLQRSRRSECLHVFPASVEKGHSRSGDGGGERGRPARCEVLVVDREPGMAGVGRWESGGVRAVPAAGPIDPTHANRAGDPTADVYPDRLILLAILEASRRQESGDTAGAWDCYRSVLRAITHFRRRGSTLQRGYARWASRVLQRRLADWAAEPRTTITQLQTALKLVLENEPDPDWDLFAVKSGYLELMRRVGVAAVAFGPAGDRRRIDVPARRHVAFARSGRFASRSRDASSCASRNGVGASCG